MACGDTVFLIGYIVMGICGIVVGLAFKPLFRRMLCQKDHKGGSMSSIQSEPPL